MKARSGYKHFANRFGGYHAECTVCRSDRKLFADTFEADEWWTIHEVSTTHTNAVARKRGRKSA